MLFGKGSDILKLEWESISWRARPPMSLHGNLSIPFMSPAAQLCMNWVRGGGFARGWRRSVGSFSGGFWASLDRIFAPATNQGSHGLTKRTGETPGDMEQVAHDM